MANYLTVRLTDDPSAVRFFQKLTLSLSFRAETERFSKIVGTFILSISNNSASVAAHIRRLIIDIGFAGMAFRAVTYLLIRSVAAVHCFAGMAFRAVTYRHDRRAPLCNVLQVWRFEQLLTPYGGQRRLLPVLQVWRFEQLLTLSPLIESDMTFCRYGVSSSYLPEPVLDSSLGEFCRYGVRAVIYL